MNNKDKEPQVIEYKGKYICRAGKYYRVKSDPALHYALHHGSFASAKEAKEFIDETWPDDDYDEANRELWNLGRSVGK